jgi:GNAT superfamily N-acetyltransferase
MDSSVRNAVPGDLDRIVELLEQLRDVMSDESALSCDVLRSNCAHLLSRENSHVIVAENEGEIIGVLHFTVRPTCMHEGSSALVDELVVDRNHRGRGTGQRLIEAAARRARTLGCVEMEVSTQRGNRRAREFYKELGFWEIGVLFEMDLTR